MADYSVFKSKVAAYLKLHRLTYSDLADKTTYKASTIRKFMGNSSRKQGDSPAVASAISTATGIEL